MTKHTIIKIKTYPTLASQDFGWRVTSVTLISSESNPHKVLSDIRRLSRVIKRKRNSLDSTCSYPREGEHPIATEGCSKCSLSNNKCLNNSGCGRNLGSISGLQRIKLLSCEVTELSKTALQKELERGNL
jgi:hypothetical protein